MIISSRSGQPHPPQNPMQVVYEYFSKIIICLLGLALLFFVSQSSQAVAALCAVSFFSYFLGTWLRTTPRTRIHQLCSRLAVPAALLGLVLLNVTGMVGTLTGAQSSASQGASTALIAMPFYLLSAAAFVTEMATQRMNRPRFLDFLVYMTLPFKLLAGPLETPRLMEQIQLFRLRFRRLLLLTAWPWIVLGAFMKYVVANRLDPARHLTYTDPVTSFVTAAVFELKFYFDFAGYSFIAYGAALMFGLRISQNFSHPFLASNVVLFWRSWHMSLGRFLSRYVLEPNLSLWQGRTQKMLFASAIFLVSALWHGGTLNYLMWGLFHGACYFIYGEWIKRKLVRRYLGILAMLLFFIFGRMFAVDMDSARLLSRILLFFDPHAYAWHLGATAATEQFFAARELRALILAALFFSFEVWSVRRYKHRQGYHFMRRPLCALVLVVLFVFFGLDTGALLYARI